MTRNSGKRSRSKSPNKEISSHKRKKDGKDKVTSIEKLSKSPNKSVRKQDTSCRNSSNNRIVIDVSKNVKKTNTPKSKGNGVLQAKNAKTNSLHEQNEEAEDVVNSVEQNNNELFHDNVRVAVSSVEDQEFASDDDSFNIDQELPSATITTPINSEEDCDGETDTDDSVIHFKRRCRASDGAGNSRDLDGDTEISPLSDDEEDETIREWKKNPAFNKYVQKLVAKETSENPNSTQVHQQSFEFKTPEKRGKKGSKLLKITDIVKSPSDTTIYVPALNKITPNAILFTSNKATSPVSQEICQNENQFTVDKISEFIQGIQVKDKQRNAEGTVDMLDSGDREPSPGSSNRRIQHTNPREQAKETANNLIIQAEQFKAAVNVPPGNEQIKFVTPDSGIKNNKFYNAQGVVKDDDDFFHLTCQIDQSIYNKIERGEFVELDKLLPRPKNGISSEPRTELIFREGRPVIVPHVDRSRIISGIHKWEQAFRVYAAIYSQANPSRSAEIWQYIFVINQAATAYTWNNVAEYDFAFRQMMSKNPLRSWAKIYAQMWNMCLTDSLPKNNNAFASMSNNSNSHSVSGGYSHRTTNQKQHSQSTKNKSNYCWKFNRGKCKFGPNCKFVNRCSYCDSPAHGLNSCPSKSQNKE